MIIENSGKPIGILTNLVSDKEVITVNGTEYVTTVVTRNRATGEVTAETFYGKNPLVSR